MSKKEFAKYFRNGKRISGRVCSLRFGILESDDTKVAVVVPSKIVARATERNRIRRTLFSTIEELMPLVVRPSFLIIIVQKRPGDDDLTQYTEEITALLRKSDII